MNRGKQSLLVIPRCALMRWRSTKYLLWVIKFRCWNYKRFNIRSLLSSSPCSTINAWNNKRKNLQKKSIKSINFVYSRRSRTFSGLINDAVGGRQKWFSKCSDSLRLEINKNVGRAVLQLIGTLAKLTFLFWNSIDFKWARVTVEFCHCAQHIKIKPLVKALRNSFYEQ